MTSPTPATRYFFKVKRQVRVRSAPGLRGSHVKWLYPGEQIAVDASSRREVDGYVWWRHTAGWTAELEQQSGERFLILIVDSTGDSPPDTPETEESPPEPATSPQTKSFRVGQSRVRTRSVPSLKGTHVRWLYSGEEIAVDPTSRREVDGYIWWRHTAGWTAERNLSGTVVLMTPIPEKTPTTQPNEPSTPADEPPATSADEAPTPVEEPPTTPIPAPVPEPAGTTDFRVGRVQVRVRHDPSLQAAHITWLQPGQKITVESTSRTEADGYVWWRHDAGWSAERDIAGSDVFLLDPDAFADRDDPDTPTGQPEPLTNDTLAQRDGLFQQLPVPLGKIHWWQYYGNNVFAYNLWEDGVRWYKYAQGLHGGLDFGNSQEAVVVEAGVNGQFIKRDDVYTKPHGMWVRVGDYTVIYGHLSQPAALSPGATITPSTVLGQLNLGGQNHLHLEVRYQGQWIVNPLLLMPPAMRNSLIAKFPPSTTYFYQDDTWTQWQTPLDQPIIKLAGDLIGPHAR